MPKCFTGETLISTAQGKVPIRDLRVGDLAYAYNHVTSDWELCPVNEKYTRVFTGQLATITVAGQSIRSTHDHPFWVVSGEDLSSRLSRAHGSEPPPGSTTPGRWVDADHLRVGDMLLSLDGGQQHVEAISLDETTIDVYNFHVDRLETYAVGVAGWLVHNTYHGYALYNKTTGEIYKFGVSRQGFSAAGLSRRAQAQITHIAAISGVPRTEVVSIVLLRNLGKPNIFIWERYTVGFFRNLGSTLPFNKLPRGLWP